MLRSFLRLLSPMFLLALPAWGASINDDYTDQSRLTEREGYTTVSPGALTITRQVGAEYPRKALRESHTHVECLAQLFVSDSGKVEEVTVLMGCPDSFEKSVRKAAKKWRFEPYTAPNGAAPSPVTFALRFRFQRPS